MNNLILSLKKLIIKAGEIAESRRNAGLIINYKEDNSIVTNGDKEISQFIYENLRILTPDIPIICEERPQSKLKDNNFWLIDPIDSTTSYVAGKNTYTINIGLIKNGEPIIGLIYQPSTKKLYYTDSKFKLKIEESGMDLSINTIEQNLTYIAILSTNRFNTKAKSFLRENSINNIIHIPSSLKLCLIAENIGDIYPCFGKTMEWDIAAGHAILKSINGNIIDKQRNQIGYGKENFSNLDFFACNSRWLNRENTTYHLE